jgi:hypothetical protein
VTGTSYSSTNRTIDWQGRGFDIQNPSHTLTINVGTGGTSDLTKTGAGNSS